MNLIQLIKQQEILRNQSQAKIENMAQNYPNAFNSLLDLKKSHALNRISNLTKEITILKQSFQFKINQSKASLLEQLRLIRYIKLHLDDVNNKIIGNTNENLDFSKNLMFQPSVF
eukprot:TRINITY_DN1687_c0_g1_i2.p2 TRINITY_DN1687_c0_g1~~TRINITY_DN1687_c0_g1_i2.p2  ORF type:complete len:115 (-),score=19.08 TRINITY_DN1687_c0_g1_i2:61-405(-)